MSHLDTHQNITALVIDDNRDAADTLVLLLNILGHQAHAAYSGSAGARLALECAPDLAIIDLDLGDLDGCDTLREIRRNTALSHTYSVCLTGRSTAEAEQRCKDAGFDRFVAKPMAPEQLQAILDTCVQRKGSG